MRLPSIHPLSDKICINCGNSFVTGVLLSKTISPYCDNCSPQVTHPCPGCEAAARERAALQAKLDTAIRACEDAYESHASMHARLQQVIEGSKRKERAFDILSDQQTDIDDALMGLPAKTSIGKTIEGLCASRRESNVLRSGIERILADYPRDIKQDAEEALRALLETEGAK